MNHVSIIFTLIVLLTLSSCDGDGLFCTKGDGNVQIEERHHTGFNKIEVRGSMDVILKQDSIESIFIETDQNILEKIESRVVADRLIIDVEGCIRRHEPITVWINTGDIEGLKIEGSGDIVSTGFIIENSMDLEVEGSGDIELGLHVDNLNTDIKGSGDVVLYGTATSHKIDIEGSGDVKALDLISEDVEIEIEGSGDVWVIAHISLDVVIRGSGDVHYKGYPLINSKIQGSGDIIDEN